MSTGIFEPIHDKALPERALIVHADKGWHDHIAQGKCDFFEKLGEAVMARGLAPLLVRADGPDAPSPLDGRQRRIMVGPRSFRAPHILHAYPAYIRGFWYLDPQGYFWNSSLMAARFNPAEVEAEAAAAFFARVSQWRLRNNVSQRKQATGRALPAAAVAVFTQNIELYSEPVHYLTTREMIRAAAGAVEGRVYVKPHPLMTAEHRDWLAKLCSRLPNTMLVEASVHDIIRASKVIVSQNSAVGVEALMQRKPVITCAATDYAAATLVSRTKDALRANIQKAEAHFADFPFEKYFYWFLGLNLLEPQSADFTARAMRILGLNEPFA